MPGGVKLSSSALSCAEVASRSLGCLFVFTFFGSGGIFPLSVIRGTHYHMRALAEVCQACYDSGHPFSGLYLLLLYEGSTRLSGPLT